MKIVLAVAFALVATTALALGEGRYLSVATTDRYGGPAVVITDTKTGKVRFCFLLSFNVLSCGLWSE